MATFLFDEIIFGPIKSRRLGVSLGINLLPVNAKRCTFDCIYCECGWNDDAPTTSESVTPPASLVKSMLRQKLINMAAGDGLPDVITFAGNGEPTLHPDFALIIDDTIELRNELSPASRIAVLSNSTMLHNDKVVAALRKVEDNILKLDSALPATVALMNQPAQNFNLSTLIGQLRQFDHHLIIQTLFLKGEKDGVMIDNTTEEEISAYIEALKQIGPSQVMIYTIARDTPLGSLERISLSHLNQLAKRITKETGLTVQVSG